MEIKNNNLITKFKMITKKLDLIRKIKNVDYLE